MKMFSEQLPRLAGGCLDNEITNAFAECIEHIDRKTTGPCVINIQIKLSPQQHRLGLMVKLCHKVDVKLPKEKPLDFTHFVSPEGNLELDNPNQGNLPFKDVKVDQPKADVLIATRQPKAPFIDPTTGEIKDE